jgi:hypothetical protein
MKTNKFGLTTMASAIVLSLAGFVSQAYADPVNATLSATYFEVLNNGSGAPDFGGSGTPNVAMGSSLGPDGLPVVSSPAGISMVNATTHEIEWWSPAMSPAVSQTGTGTISLPYGSNMYAPNSTGSNDAASFETAMFSGQFSLAASSVVSFQLGSDDDSFIYVDGILIGQNPGIHGVTNVDFDSSTLPAGNHTLDVFFADREDVGAFLSLNLLSSGVTITPTVPEPGSWALLLAGLGVVGVVTRRRQPARRD